MRMGGGGFEGANPYTSMHMIRWTIIHMVG